ncbi:MAG: hypothetical protein COB10_12130 [Planctomycetota bacterium]|nr:MAG: hypothetical protein COB10_12130 [Planctomycetota bacterium]
MRPGSSAGSGSFRIDCRASCRIFWSGFFNRSSNSISLEMGAGEAVPDGSETGSCSPVSNNHEMARVVEMVIEAILLPRSDY